MMIGERNHTNPTVHVPPWTFTTTANDPTTGMLFSPNSTANANFTGGEDYSFLLQNEALAALQRYLPSNTNDVDFDSDGDVSGKDLDLPVDAYSCDQFRMFEFKVRKCARGRSHDWTECPYAHPGEKARRRDPRKYHYSGTACPDFRKGNCRKGEACEFAHGVFECWLHPARYRTQPCKDGVNCRRRVCFFAHTPDQLRILSPRTPASVSAESYDGSPQRFAFDTSFAKMLPFISSPESSSPLSESPPLSPMTNSLSRSLGSNSLNEVVASLRQLQLNKVKSIPSSWTAVPPLAPSGLGSPRMPMTRPGFCSLPTTPTRAFSRPGIGYFDAWDKGAGCEEEPVMERVESGRDLRTRMFEKLSKENPLVRADPNPTDVPNPDVGWVSDLVQ